MKSTALISAICRFLDRQPPDIGAGIWLWCMAMLAAWSALCAIAVGLAGG